MIFEGVFISFFSPTVAEAGQRPLLDPPQEGPDWGKCTWQALAASPKEKINLPSQVQEHHTTLHTVGSCQKTWTSLNGGRASSAAPVLQGSFWGGNLPSRGWGNQASWEMPGVELTWQGPKQVGLPQHAGQESRGHAPAQGARALRAHSDWLRGKSWEV